MTIAGPRVDEGHRPADGVADEVLAGAVRDARRGTGVDEAFRTIDARVRPWLLRYFQSHGFRPAEAEDLVQTTLARVFQGVQRLEAEEKFLVWLFAIARNVRRTAGDQRRRGPIALVSLEEISEPPDERSGSGSEEKEDAAARQALWAAVARLPARQRQCLPLQVCDGLSYEEIAGLLRLSVHTVRNHLAAARRKLRHALNASPEART